MNLTKFKSRILNVTLSTSDHAKRQATNVISSSTSPQPESTPNGDTITLSTPHASHPTRQEIYSRTLALLNIPDTINDARIRALAESYGALVKVVLRPDHQGAIVEFKDVASAGKAALGIEGVEIIGGRRIRVGDVSELLREKEERKGGLETGKGLQASAVVRRPVQQRKRGGKGGGGLGSKREMVTNGNGNANRNGTNGVGVGEGDGDGELKVESNGADGNGTAGKSSSKSKNNADFKAMFLK